MDVTRPNRAIEHTLRKAIAIRRAETGDIIPASEGIVSMWTTHLEHHPELFYDTKARDTNMARKYCIEAMANPDCRFLVAEAKGQHAGFVIGFKRSISDFFREKMVMHISGLYVGDEFRGTGVSHSLMGELIRITRRLGIRRMQANVYTFNEPMQNLMRSEGFELIHSIWDKLLDEAD